MPVEGSALQPPKNDPNVKLPPAVKAAADRAEALAKQAKEQAAANPGGSDNVRPLAPPSPPNPGVVMGNFDPKNPQPPGEPSRPNQQPPQAPQPPTPAPGDYEHQFNSLKGRYDRQAEDNKRMAAQIGDMQRLLALMPSGPQPQPQPAMPVPQGQGSGVQFSGPVTGQPLSQGRRVSAKDIEEYGEDFIKVMERAALDANAPVFGQIMNELGVIKRHLGGVTNNMVYDARTRMYDGFERDVPNWREINTHPDFLAWLNVPDPLSGQVRKDLLNQAYANNQGTRVTEFFKRFLADQAASGLQAPMSQPGNGANPSPQVNMADLAAPGRAKPGQTGGPPEKPIVTVADIKQFYRDVTAGVYAGRDDEKLALEKMIFEAGRENRVK